MKILTTSGFQPVDLRIETELEFQALLRAVYKDNPTGDMYEANQAFFTLLDDIRIDRNIKDRDDE